VFLKSGHLKMKIAWRKRRMQSRKSLKIDTLVRRILAFIELMKKQLFISGCCPVIDNTNRTGIDNTNRTVID
jgi:hypothetical protein